MTPRKKPALRGQDGLSGILQLGICTNQSSKPRPHVQRHGPGPEQAHYAEIESQRHYRQGLLLSGIAGRQEIALAAHYGRAHRQMWRAR